jgi:hypothetical protein
LRRLAQELGGARAIQAFVGHDELVDWYNRASLVVVPFVPRVRPSAVEAQSRRLRRRDRQRRSPRRHHRWRDRRAVAPPGITAETIARLLDDAPRRRTLGAAAASVRETYARTASERFVRTYGKRPARY